LHEKDEKFAEDALGVLGSFDFGEGAEELWSEIGGVWGIGVEAGVAGAVERGGVGGVETAAASYGGAVQAARIAGGGAGLDGVGGAIGLRVHGWIFLLRFFGNCVPPTPLKEQKSAEVIENIEAIFCEVQKSDRRGPFLGKAKLWNSSGNLGWEGRVAMFTRHDSTTNISCQYITYWY
jgi:hypothetical protein